MDMMTRKQIDTFFRTTQTNLRDQVERQLPPPVAEAVLDEIMAELEELHQSILNYLALHSLVAAPGRTPGAGSIVPAPG